MNVFDPTLAEQRWPAQKPNGQVPTAVQIFTDKLPGDDLIATGQLVVIPMPRPEDEAP
jgi:hypothetical protein